MPVFTCTATQNSAQGLYEISVSNAEATNYSFTYKGGTLTILPNITSDEVTVSTFSAGSLSTELGSSAWKTIRNLTVSGQINGTDIRLIRKMLQEGKLEELNLHDAKIVSGGDSYDIYGLSKTSEDVICSRSRKQEIVYMRQLAIYLSSKHTEQSTVQIGNRLGGRNHATVIHSINQIRNLIDTDEKTRQDIKELEIRMKI